MLILTTTAAELCIRLEAAAESWLVYEARFLLDTPYRLETGENLSDLRCQMRAFVRDIPAQARGDNDLGTLVFVRSAEATAGQKATQCKIDMRVGRKGFHELAIAARAGHIPSRVAITLHPKAKGDLRTSSSLWFVESTDVLRIRAVSFTIGLVTPETAPTPLTLETESRCRAA